MKRHWHVVGALFGSVLLADPDLLEFLGTVDTNEAGWHDYLAENDVDRVAGKTSPPALPPPKPAVPNPPPALSIPRKVK